MAIIFDGEFIKDIDTDIAFDLTSNTTLTLTKTDVIAIAATSVVVAEGNFASATFSAEATGDNTFAEADVHVLVVEGSLSSVDGVLVAGASEDLLAPLPLP